MKTAFLLSIVALVAAGCASSKHEAYTGTWCSDSSNKHEALLVTDDGKFVLLSSGKGTITKQEYCDDNSYNVTINDTKNPSKELATCNIKYINKNELLATTLKEAESTTSGPTHLYRKPTR